MKNILLLLLSSYFYLWTRSNNVISTQPSMSKGMDKVNEQKKSEENVLWGEEIYYYKSWKQWICIIKKLEKDVKQ